MSNNTAESQSKMEAAVSNSDHTEQVEQIEYVEQAEQVEQAGQVEQTILLRLNYNIYYTFRRIILNCKTEVSKL